MTPTEHLAIYAVENKAIIYILVIALIVVLSGGVGLLLLYIMEHIKVKQFRRRDHEYVRRIGKLKEEINALRDASGQSEEVKEQAREAEFEADRQKKIRSKTEERLREQNDELSNLRKQLQNQSDELNWLKKIIEHHDFQ